MRYFLTVSVSLSVAQLFCAARLPAHDLPASAHPATAQSGLVERLLASQPPSNPSTVKLFSFVATKLTWEPRTLNVCFWNGDPSRRAAVAALADGLASLTTVKFSWGNGDRYRDCPAVGFAAFPVRVSLEKDASLLSQDDNAEDYFTDIGRMILSDSRQANVNLPFPADATPPLYTEKILHEFCHVLGCLHEHQRGLCDNDFAKQRIMAKYGYSEEQYRENFIAIPSSNAFYGSKMFGGFDEKSIMLYSIPAEFFANPSTSKCYRQKPAIVLSSDDEAGLRQAYNRAPEPELQLASDFKRLAGSYATQALRIRGQALAFRSTARDWAKNTHLLNGSKRIQVLETFTRYADDADAKAAETEKLAESYRLTPEAEALLSELVKRLPD